MEYNNGIYVLGAKQGSRRLGVRKVLGPRELIYCEVKPGHQRSTNEIEKLSVELPQEALTLEMSWTWMSDCLIGRYVSSLLFSSGVTGFQTRPVEITVKGKPVDHDLEELVPIGWGGIAAQKSGVKLLESCPSCGYLRYSGVKNWTDLIDLSQWDGSDIFLVWPLPKYILITDKVRRILEANRIKEMTITPLSTMQPQDSELSPGRVRDWLPLEKLRSIAIPDLIA